MKRIFLFVFIAMSLNTFGQQKTAQGIVAPVLPAMSKSEIKAGLKTHNKALYIKEHWIRDPYIILGPDNYYYLTGTTANPDDSREQSDPYNKGLFEGSIVGSKVQLWISKNLIDWKYLGTPYSIEDAYLFDNKSKDRNVPLWAPEIHWVDGKWALVHCPSGNSSLAFSEGKNVEAPWTHTMGKAFHKKHDPSLFQDDDGSWYALWANTYIAKINDDFSGFASKPYFIRPSSKRPNPNNPEKMISRIGHEGATMRKIGGKYVSFGTAWSTDKMRKGSYNLYYCVADEILGEYGPRKFVGRFLGHGTPFQDKEGRWWCTAFYNGDVPPLEKDGIQEKDLSKTAQTINQRGTTIVPLEVKVLDNGEIYIRAKDPAYAMPGPDENQDFNLQ
ncbi:family 43 glycosylhydrolase [Sediminitomix flava]|uniref:Glycosyl hydrolase family 43 n=1 Tax=Sediminitomix flava TaxID=379075 RepID=A0A315Z5F6_SEDFL|nr:family 43 glycosylhydrolase [Sediminitomix flava]PWJ37992.1 glycosyl hydrolase family 43 [Sediminitomix flava]